MSVKMRRSGLGKAIRSGKKDMMDVSNLRKKYQREQVSQKEDALKRLRNVKMLLDMSNIAENIGADAKKTKQEQDYIDKHGLTQVSTPGLWGTSIGSESYYVGTIPGKEGEEDQYFKLDPGQVSAYTTQSRVGGKDPMDDYKEQNIFNPFEMKDGEAKYSPEEIKQIGAYPSRPEISIGDPKRVKAPEYREGQFWLPQEQRYVPVGSPEHVAFTDYIKERNLQEREGIGNVEDIRTGYATKDAYGRDVFLKEDPDAQTFDDWGEAPPRPYEYDPTILDESGYAVGYLGEGVDEKPYIYADEQRPNVTKYAKPGTLDMGWEASPDTLQYTKSPLSFEDRDYEEVFQEQVSKIQSGELDEALMRMNPWDFGRQPGEEWDLQQRKFDLIKSIKEKASALDAYYKGLDSGPLQFEYELTPEELEKLG
jgi:hypothetical protein